MALDVKRATDSLSLASPAARTTNGQGSGVDVQKYTGLALVLLHSSAGSGTTPTLDVKIQHSDNNSSWSDVPGAAFAQVTDASALIESISLNMDAVKRYIRAVWTIGGTSPSFTFGVSLMAINQLV